MRAKVELLTAPTREIIGPRFGIHAANITAKEFKRCKVVLKCMITAKKIIKI